MSNDFGGVLKSALVLGAGGFIGSHLVRKLKVENYWVRGVDLKTPEFSDSEADEFMLLDLRSSESVKNLLLRNGSPFDEIYQLAADMGGAGFVFSGENDADIMHNSAVINLNVLDGMVEIKKKIPTNTTRVFYSSSACMYPSHNQEDPNNPNCSEDSAYPAAPDSEYGWEKLFSERLYFAYYRNYGIPVRVARYHNIFGPEGTWDGGREKAPAAICRKVAIANKIDEIEVWGDGEQTRSFLFIDECIEATLRLMKHPTFIGPINIGSEEMVTINQLASMAIAISEKDLIIKNIEGQEFIEKYGFKCPLGVKGRNSDNKLFKQKIGWEVNQPLSIGLKKTYRWIKAQVEKP